MQQSWKAFGEESIYSVPVSHISFLGYFQPNSVKLVVWSLFPDQGNWDFPGDPVVETLHLNSRGVSSIPGWRIKISHVTWPKTKQKHLKKQKTRRWRLRVVKWHALNMSEPDWDPGLVESKAVLVPLSGFLLLLGLTHFQAWSCLSGSGSRAEVGCILHLTCRVFVQSQMFIFLIAC